MLGESLNGVGQSNNLPGIIPSLFYRGRITNRLDYNLFASTTFIPVKSTIEGKEYPARNSEVFLQSSFVYKFSKEMNFAIGYTNIKSTSFQVVPEIQRQVWQQAIVEHRAFKGLMLHRFRLIEIINKNFAPVLNYQIAFEKPLQGRVLDNDEFYFTCFNEMFFDLSSNQKIFYQANWTFAGIGYKTLRAGKFEIGPLVQITFNSEQNSQNALYLLQILWLSDFKLFKH
jgi:hypothetical protein